MRDALSSAFEDQDTDTPPDSTGSEVVDVEPTGTEEPATVVEGIQTDDVQGEIAGEAETHKAPQSWGVAEREEWAALSPALQAQIAKRESEIGHSLTTTGEARHFQQEFQQVVQPFEGFIKAEGATPMQAVGNLLQTAATLQGGSQQQKASRVAELIKHYGVDIRTLDSLLAGEQPETGPNAQFGDMLNQAMAPVNQFMQQQQNVQQQQFAEQQQNTQSELSAFEAAHEFVPDVRMDMADLMEMAGRRNEPMTLEQAYEKAIMLRPDIKQVIDQRKAAANAQGSNRTLNLKRSAAVSMPGGDAAHGTGQGPSTMREQLQAAWDT